MIVGAAGAAACSGLRGKCDLTADSAESVAFTCGRGSTPVYDSGAELHTFPMVGQNRQLSILVVNKTYFVITLPILK